MRKLGQAVALVWVVLAFSPVSDGHQAWADEPRPLPLARKAAKAPVVLTTGSTRVPDPADLPGGRARPPDRPENTTATDAPWGLRGTLGPEEPRL